MNGTTFEPQSVGRLLAIEIGLDIEPRRDLWGFGGLHGGLTLALLAERMQRAVGAGALRSVAAQYHRPLRRPFQIETEVTRQGRTMAATSATASVDGSRAVTASGIFAAGEGRAVPLAASAPPDAPPPADCPVFTIPTELVPFAQHTEIRPVGANRPFASGREPELTAWIRLVDDDEPPDALRLIVLMDSLAPSSAAVLDAPVAIPTIELSVRPTGAIGERSPWVLLRSTTRSVHGGWVDESIDAWSIDGAHLATATQLRLVMS